MKGWGDGPELIGPSIEWSSAGMRNDTSHILGGGGPSMHKLSLHWQKALPQVVTFTCRPPRDEVTTFVPLVINAV